MCVQQIKILSFACVIVVQVIWLLCILTVLVDQATLLGGAVYYCMVHICSVSYVVQLSQSGPSALLYMILSAGDALCV